MARGDAITAERRIGAEWPIDLQSLGKGDEIGPDVLVSFLDAEFGSNVYQRLLLEFVRKLEGALLAIGKRYVVRCRQGSAAILTDQEAAIYTQCRFESHRRGLSVSHRRAQRVDGTALPADDRARHDRALLVQGGLLAGITRTITELNAVPYERNIPLAFGDDPAA